jgi:hypothetical protein
VRVIARAGNGPGEVSRVNAVVRAAADTVWVVDGSRRLIFDPLVRFVRMESMPGGGFDFVPGPAGTVVTEGLVGTPEAAGYPLHLRDLKFAIVKSFGTDDTTLDARLLAATGDDATMLLRRRFTPSAAGTFWTYNDTRFLLEKYDVTGRLSARFRHALDGWYADATRRSPSPGGFRGLELHDVQISARPNIIWLVYHDRRPNFVEPTRAFEENQWRSMHDLVVEAFDAQRGIVVASTRFPQAIALKVDGAPDELAISHPIDDVFYTFRIMKLRIVQTPT